jgi:hypothetical protein
MLVCHLVGTMSFIQDGLSTMMCHLPPLVGCSILITSALGVSSAPNSLILPTSVVGSYRAVYLIPKISQYLRTIRLQIC